MTITRPHHPLLGETLPVVGGAKRDVVVRLPDGSTLRVPREWTDVGGSPSPASPAEETVCRVDDLRRLARLVDALGRRS